MNSKIRVRLVWRLLLCLFAHLTLLLVLAIYLEFSLTSAQSFTPVANAEEVQMESLDTVPTLLEAMDTDRRALESQPAPASAAYLDSYRQAQKQVEQSLASLDRPQLTPSPAETERRAVIRQWLAEVGKHVGTPHPTAAPDLDAQSRTLLDRLNVLTPQVRAEVRGALQNLQQQEATEAGKGVTLMWAMVGVVTFFTILIQMALSNSIIGPIQILQAAVRRLQKGDYAARAHLHSGDEIQNLGETFNAMAANIQQSQRQLEQKNGTLSLQQEALRHANASLEQRVSQKTQELEEKNQKLSEAARLKDEFLATLSHELRTPLTPIISCAHLLTDTEPGAEHQKNVQTIERNARALSRMIDELLDLSAVMNRKLRLERERTEMNEWTRATLETMRPGWEKKGLSVVFFPSDKPVEMEIDPTRLAQVLTNLINNAVKFTDPGGRIEVRLSVERKRVRIAVTDTGAGLDQRETERIFEMFHQSRTRRTHGVGGLGVGLTVARSLSELHGGGLLAESAGLGQGSTFTLWLPPGKPGDADFSSTNLVPPVAAVDRALLRGRSVLLVEDATDTREALQRIFERRGCRVRTASNAEEALALAAQERPEIVVSDIGLPGMSGLEFLPRLKAQPGGRDIIAIALSGLGREKDIRAASEAGFDAHLLKPVEIPVLDQTLVEALQSRVVSA
jgi:signal transduction histidine kinase/ActR/RegA family two-component response regulator